MVYTILTHIPLTTKIIEMSTENQVVKATQIPITEIMSIGKAFAESGMFADIKSAAQAVVKIQAGQEIGIPPFAAMSGIHIIQGKPTIGAGLMASRVKGSGKYDYKVMQQDEKACSIDFYQGKEKIGNSTFTIEDAKKAGTKNIDKFPRNMLFARAISNGIKWYCPDIFSSAVYTPEEMETVTIETEAEVIKDDLNETHPQWGAAIKALRNGTRDLEYVKDKYNLSPEAETALLTAVNEPA